MQWYHKYVKATCIEYCGLAMPAWGGPLRTPKNWFFERFYIIKSNWKSSSLFCLLFPLASCCRTLPIDILSTIFWSMQEHHLNILSTEFWSMGQIYSMYKFFFSVAVLNPYHILSTSGWLYIYIVFPCCMNFVWFRFSCSSKIIEWSHTHTQLTTLWGGC